MDCNKLFTYDKYRFERTASSFRFENLSDEVFYFIFIHLETNELLNFSKTNSRFFRLIKPWFYKRILVYDPEVYRKLEYANESVIGTFPVDYTVVSMKNFCKLFKMYSFEPDLIKCVFFYFTPVPVYLLDQLPSDCTIEIQTHLDNKKHIPSDCAICLHIHLDNKKHIPPRLQFLLDVYNNRKDPWEGSIKVVGSCSDYRSNSKPLDIKEISKEVQLLELGSDFTERTREKFSDYRIKVEDLEFENLKSLICRSLLYASYHSINLKLEYLRINFDDEDRPFSDELRQNLKTLEIHGAFYTDSFPNAYVIAIADTTCYHSLPRKAQELYIRCKPIKYNLLERTKSISTMDYQTYKETIPESLKMLWILGLKDGQDLQYFKIMRCGELIEVIPIFKKTSPPGCPDWG